MAPGIQVLKVWTAFIWLAMGSCEHVNMVPNLRVTQDRRNFSTLWMTTRCLSESPSHGRIYRSCTVQHCMLATVPDLNSLSLSLSLSVHTKLLQELVTISFPLKLNHKFSIKLPPSAKHTLRHPYHIHRSQSSLLIPPINTTFIRQYMGKTTNYCRQLLVCKRYIWWIHKYPKTVKSHLKILRVRRVTRSKFHFEEPQTSSTIVQNLLARTWR